MILNNDQEYLKSLIFVINKFIEAKLKLSLHSDKIKIRKYRQGIDFLGYISFPYHRILRTKTKRRMFRKIEQKVKELKQGKIPNNSLDQSVQSYLGVLQHCNSYKLQQQLKNKIQQSIK